MKQIPVGTSVYCNSNEVPGLFLAKVVAHTKDGPVVRIDSNVPEYGGFVTDGVTIKMILEGGRLVDAK